MSPLYKEYRQQADYCMKMAEGAPNEEMRADWLRLAGKWLAMIPQREKSEHERFETAIHGRSPRQNGSATSH
jgi:hypothetical protein